MSNMTTETIRSHREQGLSATIHRACTSCGAPGIYTEHEAFRASHPGCYVDPSDERVGQPVGSHCPNCKASRSPGLIDRLGEIWRRRYV